MFTDNESQINDKLIPNDVFDDSIWFKLLKLNSIQTNKFSGKDSLYINYKIIYDEYNKTNSYDWTQIYADINKSIPYAGSELFLRTVEKYAYPDKTTINSHDIYKLIIQAQDNQTYKENTSDILLSIEHMIITKAILIRYEVFISNLIRYKGNYSKCLNLDLQEFVLKAKPSELNQIDKEAIIEKVIAYVYLLTYSELERPFIRDVAEYINSPYSVVLKAINKFEGY